MSALTIMQRLPLNWAEIASIKRAFTFEPNAPIDKEDLPAVYPIQAGRMTRPTPRTSAGQYEVERTYIYRLLVAEALAASMDSADLGAYMDELTITLIDDPIDYFMQHPRLNATALPELTLSNDISLQDSGLVFRLGPGGGQYAAIDYTFTIAERRHPAIKRLG